MLTTRATISDSYVHGQARGKALSELCRLRNARVPWLVFVAAGLNAELSTMNIVGGIVLIGAAYSAASALNDRADIETDRLNGRTDRPLVSGELSDRDVRSVVVAASAGVVMSQLLLSQPSAFAVTALALAIGVGYSVEPFALQRRGLVGLIALSWCYLGAPLLLAFGAKGAGVSLAMGMVGAGVLAHKDFRDLNGDLHAAKRTLLVRHGEKLTTRLAVAVTMLGLVVLAGIYGASWWAVPGAFTLVGLMAMAVAGHKANLWMMSRVALVATAVLVALQ